MGGITCLLLLLWAGVTMSTPVDLHKRIVGGTTCNDNEHRYHVKLRLDNGHGRIEYCGGSLISKRWILTAAHCLDKTMTAYLRLHPHTPKNITRQIIETEPYDSNIDTHDIMLLKMSEDAPADIKPVEFDCGKRANLAEVEMAGYGPTSATSTAHSRTLQCVKIKVDDCNKDGFTFCGETDDGKKYSKQVDSGGGAVHDQKIYGVISLGSSSIIVYADVCKYIKWINETIA